MSASTRRPDLLFEIVWLGWDEQEVGRFDLLRYDLTEAIKSACSLMLTHAPKDAHGFFVRRKEEDS